MKKIIIDLLLVGSGGFFGSSGRYLLSTWVDQRWKDLQFPLGTLSVNVIGCLLIGWVLAWGESKEFFDERTRLLIVTGFLGGFTTFSTFGHESFSLIQKSAFPSMLLSIGLNVSLGLIAVWAGHSLAK